MAHNKSYDRGVGTMGCINYMKCTVKKGQCLDGLPEIYKDFFRKDGKNKKWIFRAEKRKKPKKGQKQINCEDCKKQSNCEDDNLVFRTSLEKAFGAYEIDSADRRKKEEDLIREFKRKLYHYTNNVPADGDILEWLALMRHYFGPTRLLDCTYSFFIACYFAVNEINVNKEVAEVWAIDANWLSYKEKGVERIEDIIGKRNYDRFSKKVGRLVQKEHVDKDCGLANEIIYFLMKRRSPCVYNITPFRLNQRVIAQNGTFLLQGDITKCFVRNLEATFRQNELKDKNNLRRVVIKLSTIEEKKDILRLLNDMGIKHAALFPDLHGFAESLWRRLAFPW